MKNFEEYILSYTVQPIAGVSTLRGVKADLTVSLPLFYKDYREEHPDSTETEAIEALWKLVDKWSKENHIEELGCTLQATDEETEKVRRSETKYLKSLEEYIIPEDLKSGQLPHTLARYDYYTMVKDYMAEHPEADSRQLLRDLMQFTSGTGNPRTMLKAVGDISDSESLVSFTVYETVGYNKGSFLA